MDSWMPVQIQKHPLVVECVEQEHSCDQAEANEHSLLEARWVKGHAQRMQEYR
jgi:hypothetical protein